MCALSSVPALRSRLRAMLDPALKVLESRAEFRRRSVDEEGQQELCRVTVAHVHHGREPMRPGGGHRRADVRVHPLAEELVAGRGRLSTGLHPSLSSSAVRRRAPAWVFLLGSRVLPSRQPRQSAASKTKLRRSIPRITICAERRRRSLQWPSDACMSTSESVVAYPTWAQSRARVSRS